ncbi:MAG: DNA recombination protein RmuC [Candidatus Niyogibacteria bacterium]|nr:DNA recombination protein RmuC [Candidatus Niyogibacteria bacterium]
MATTALIIIGAIILTAIGIAFFYFYFKSRRTDDNALLLLQNQLNEITRTLDAKLGESTKAIQTQFGVSTRIIRDVTDRLAKLDETNRQVVGFADQLQSLQDILKNPKQRGVLGEYYLETVLKNVMPPAGYQMQYKFEDGEIVDAVIFLDKNKFLPIDSKFSLENYNRILETNNKEDRERLEKVFKQDLKTRIDETSKYIRPKEGTMDFAFMFIPSEAIYYDLLINQVGAVKTSTRDLIEYAFKDKHVIIVSPTSFMAYLQTVLQGLRALKIEESAKEIRKRVEELGRHLGNYEQFMARLGGNLNTTVNAYNVSYKELAKIDKDVLRITGEKIGIEPQKVDKPSEID